MYILKKSIAKNNLILKANILSFVLQMENLTSNNY